MVRPHAHRPRLSPTSLGLVVMAHLGGLMALASLHAAAPQIPASALMVDVIRADAEAPKSPEIKPPKPAPAVAPAKPQTATPERTAQRTPAATPVLATESPLASATGAEPKTEKTVASASPPAPTPEVVQSNVSPSAPRFDADYLQNPAPAYPPLSRRAGEEGKVVLKVYVEPSGLASQVEIQKSSDFEQLDKAALSAVRRWKFVPARQGSVAVGAWVLVPIVFSLKG